MTFPAATDSNSPAFWAWDDGLLQLHVLNSSRWPVLSVGPQINQVRGAEPVGFSGDVDDLWMEAVVPAPDGTLYGYYHTEPIGGCEEDGRTAPRIGAAVSTDLGRGWDDLGIILAGSADLTRCDSSNKYFVGGVGDFSVILDRDERYLYVFFSAYSGSVEQQGVLVARMLWADRDLPAGRLEVWSDGWWREPVLIDDRIVFLSPTPIYAASVSWHDPDFATDAFWGPSVHWNTYLEQYVMLLNHSADQNWTQEGVYVAFSPSLEDPTAWSTPQKILEGGKWYPQVIGLTAGEGTDKTAGQIARFFMGGESEYLIAFSRPEAENVSNGSDAP